MRILRPRKRIRKEMDMPNFFIYTEELPEDRCCMSCKNGSKIIVKDGNGDEMKSNLYENYIYCCLNPVSVKKHKRDYCSQHKLK